MPLPEHIKETLPPDILALKQWAKKRELKAKQTQYLIKTGKIKVQEKVEEKIEIDEREKTVYQDEEGKLRD